MECIPKTKMIITKTKHNRTARIVNATPERVSEIYEQYCKRIYGLSSEHLFFIDNNRYNLKRENVQYLDL